MPPCRPYGEGGGVEECDEAKLITSFIPPEIASPRRRTSTASSPHPRSTHGCRPLLIASAGSVFYSHVSIRAAHSRPRLGLSHHRVDLLRHRSRPRPSFGQLGRYQRARTVIAHPLGPSTCCSSLASVCPLISQFRLPYTSGCPHRFRVSQARWLKRNATSITALSRSSFTSCTDS